MEYPRLFHYSNQNKNTISKGEVHSRDTYLKNENLTCGGKDRPHGIVLRRRPSHIGQENPWTPAPPGRLVPQLGIQPLHCLCVLIFEKYNIPCIWDPWWWLHVIKLRSNLWSEYIKMLLIGRFRSWCKNHIYPTYRMMESRYAPHFEQIDHSAWLLPDATRTLHLNLALSLWSL